MIVVTLTPTLPVRTRAKVFFFTHTEEDTEISRWYKISHGISCDGRKRGRILYLDSPQRRPVSGNWKAGMQEEKKEHAGHEISLRLLSGRGGGRKGVNCEDESLWVFRGRRRASVPPVFLMYISMPRAAPSRGEKQAGKKARFNGRNEFPATWSAIASALFSAPFVNTPPPASFVPLVYTETTLITSTYPLRATSSHWTSEVYACLHHIADDAAGRKPK